MHLTLTPLDLPRTFALQQLGRYDPTAQLTPARFAKTWTTAAGPARLEARAAPGGMEIEAHGAVDAAAWAAWSPLADGHDAFVTQHPGVARLHRNAPGLRILPMPWLFDVACGAILQQRVAFLDAVRAFARLARKYGETEGEVVRFPSAARIAGLPSWAYPDLGIDPRRGRALWALARAESSRGFLGAASSHAELRARLLAIPGVGPWTTEMILGFGAGDPDALPLGDLHLPRLVAQAFGDAKPPSDPRMVELLEPYRGQRFRVVRLILATATQGRRPVRRSPW